MGIWSSLWRRGYSFVSRVFRVGRMAGTLATGSIVSLGIEKIVLIPLLLEMMGKDTLGRFILILSWVQLMAQFTSRGAADGIMRLYIKAKEQEGWVTLLATGTGMTCLTCFVLLVTAGGVFLAIARGNVEPLVVLTAVCLGTFGIFMTAKNILNVSFRVDLQFGRIAFVEIFIGIVLLLSVPLAYLLGIMGAGVGYALAVGLAIGLQLWLIRNKIRGQRFLDMSWVKPLILVVPIFVLANLLGIAATLSGRLFLGAYRPVGDVTIFFAAEVIIAIVLSPVGFLGSVIYTLVVRKAKVDDISLTVLLQHIVSCVACTILVFVTIRLVGEQILKWRYPSVAEASWPLVKILAIGGSLKTGYFLSRGFVYRFCSFKRILFCLVISFAVVGVMLTIMVPTWGLWGAAWAVSIGSAITGLLWFGTYVQVFVVRRIRQRTS